MGNSCKKNTSNKKSLINVLTVFGFDIVYFLMMYLALYIPVLTIKYFNENRVGIAKAALYPFYYSNIAYIVIIVIITIIFSVISIRYCKKYPVVEGMVFYSFVFVAIVFLGGNFESNVFKEIVNYKNAIVSYETGKTSTYYGTLIKENTVPIGGVFLDGNFGVDGYQTWRVDGLYKDFEERIYTLYSSLNLDKHIKIEPSKAYKVTYLEGTNIICNIEDDTRKSKDFPVLLNNFANNYKSTNESQELTNIVENLKIGHYSPVSNGIFQKYPDAIIEYTEVDINLDSLKDYILTVTSDKNSYKGIVLLLNKGPDELYLDIYFDYNLYNKNFNISTIKNLTNNLYDIKLQLEGEEEPLYFKYSLSRNFIQF